MEIVVAKNIGFCFGVTRAVNEALKINEKEFAFSLEESLNRSRQKKLLENLTFIITVNVFPSRTVLSRIITSAGGKVIKTKK